LKQLLYRWFSPLLRWLLKGKMKTKQISGTNMKLQYPMDQHLGFLLSKEIKYEEDIRREILPFVKPGSIVFEIGSNIGQYTLSLSEQIGSNGHLIAIEPDHDNFFWLSKNCEANHCTNVTLVCNAVSDQEGNVRFFKDTITGGRSGSLIEKFAGRHYQGQWENVQTTTYNTMTKKYGVPDFVKVDTEGAEEFIFTSTAQVHPSTVFFIEVRQETAHSIFNRFTSEGFSIYQIGRGLTLITGADSIQGLTNLLIYKK
jgi:FkbM family methyltransferase